MVSSEDECRRIVANLKLFWTPDYRIPHQPIRKEGSLLFPFGCVYASNKQFYWNPPVGIQESVPCGSSWGGEKYYCICSKYRKLYKFCLMEPMFPNFQNNPYIMSWYVSIKLFLFQVAQIIMIVGTPASIIAFGGCVNDKVTTFNSVYH